MYVLSFFLSLQYLINADIIPKVPAMIAARITGFSLRKVQTLNPSSGGSEVVDVSVVVVVDDVSSSCKILFRIYQSHEMLPCFFHQKLSCVNIGDSETVLFG